MSAVARSQASTFAIAVHTPLLTHRILHYLHPEHETVCRLKSGSRADIMCDINDLEVGWLSGMCVCAKALSPGPSFSVCSSEGSGVATVTLGMTW